MIKCVISIIISMEWIYKKMNKYIVLSKKKNLSQLYCIIKDLKLKNTLKNKRTSIWENNDLEISIDKYIIRITIYSNEDVQYYTNYILQR